MIYTEEFTTWEEQIEALPLNDTHLPKVPVDEFAAKAESLANEAKKDKEELATAGLDISLIDEVGPLAAALRHYQSRWLCEFRTRQESYKEWLEKLPKARKERDEILHHFKFAYRSQPDVLAQVMLIKQRANHSNMIQNLIDLALIGQQNMAQLTAINFNPSRLSKARSLSQNLSLLLAQTNGSAEENSHMKHLRDKAYTLLEKRVNTICDFGRYVFWKNKDRRKKYLHNFKL